MSSPTPPGGCEISPWDALRSAEDEIARLRHRLEMLPDRFCLWRFYRAGLTPKQADVALYVARSILEEAEQEAP